MAYELRLANLNQYRSIKDRKNERENPPMVFDIGGGKNKKKRVPKELFVAKELFILSRGQDLI